MTGLVDVDQVWRWQGRGAQAAVSSEWGHWGSLRRIRDASRGTSRMSTQTCWAGRSRDLCSQSVNDQVVAALGWSQVHKSVGVLPFETDA
jgi:hypothetical protein